LMAALPPDEWSSMVGLAAFTLGLANGVNIELHCWRLQQSFCHVGLGVDLTTVVYRGLMQRN
jgi:hypothetical protein